MTPQAPAPPQAATAGAEANISGSGPDQPPTRSFIRRRSPPLEPYLARHWREIIAGALLTALPGVAWSLLSGYELSWIHLTSLIPLFTGVVVMLGYIHFRARIAEHWPGPEWAGTVPGLLRASLFAAAAIPMLVTLAGADRLEKARFCQTAGEAGAVRPFDGLFVGATADYVYIGDADGNRRIHAFPAGVTGEVIVGADSAGAACD